MKKAACITGGCRAAGGAARRAQHQADLQHAVGAEREGVDPASARHARVSLAAARSTSAAISQRSPGECTTAAARRSCASRASAQAHRVRRSGSERRAGHDGGRKIQQVEKRRRRPSPRRSRTRAALDRAKFAARLQMRRVKAG
jgi:hypothetical protein